MYRMVLCALLFPVVLRAQPQQPKLPISVRILVTDSLSGLPLERASVRVNRHRDIHFTNAQGWVIIDSLPEGKLMIQCSFIGYHSIEQFAKIKPRQTINLKMCQETHHLHEFELTDASGKPVTGLSLQNKTILEGSLLRNSQGQNLGDLLKPLLGVSVLNSGPAISKPVIRGLHSNRIITMNNDVKQEGQQWGAEHAPEIDPFAINRLELIRGASSVEYGPDAIGGVVKVAAREFRKETGLGGILQTGLYSNNRQGALSLSLDGNHHVWKQSISWTLQGSMRKAGDAQAPDYVISNTGFEERDGMAAFRWTLHSITLTGRMSVFSTRMGIMRASHIGNTADLLRAMQQSRPLYIHPFTYEIAKPMQEVWHEIQQLNLRYSINRNTAMNLNTSRQFNIRSEYDLGVSWNSSSSTTNKAAYRLTLSTLQAEGSLEHRILKVSGKLGMGTSSQSNYSEGTQKPIIPGFTSQTGYAFLIEKYSRGRWQMEGGLRFDYRTQTAYFRNRYNEVEQDARSFNSSTLVMGGRYQFSSTLGMMASVATGWRPPAMNELYSNGLHNSASAYEIGNPALLRERNVNLETGFKIQTTQLLIEAGVFMNTITDFIYLLPDPVPTVTLRGTFPTFHFTQTDARIQGAEAQGKLFFNRSWVLELAASYLLGTDLKSKQPLIYMPANRMRTGLKYQPITTYNWFIEGEVHFVAGQSKYPSGLDYMNPPDAYSLVHFHAGIDLPIRKESMHVSLSVYNVLNTSYRDYLNRFRYYTDEPGMNLILRITVPFSVFKPKSYEK